MGSICSDCCSELLGSAQNNLVFHQCLEGVFTKEVSSILPVLLSLHGPSSNERGEESPQEQIEELANNSRD